MRKFIGFFIPEKHKKDAENNRKSIFSVAVLFVVLIINIIFIVYYWIAHPEDMVSLFVGVSFTCLIIGNLILFKRIGSFAILSNFFCATGFIAIALAPFQTGGIFSVDLYTLVLLPVFGLILGNKLTGYFWLALTFLVFISFYVIDKVNYTDFRSMTEKLNSEYYMLNVVTVLIGLSFLVFRNEKLRLTLVKEIRQALGEIEEKNKEITDSINYAKRIQDAQLPRTEEINKHLAECFVLFKPKDIVSGDFYFFNEFNGSVLIAAGDCTGHGVPGALMSMIGSERLSDAIQKSRDVSEILSLLNKGVKLSLKQSEEESSTRDGMDIAICNIAGNKVEYSGANRPLWILKKNENHIEEIKATKTAIAGFTDNEQKFDKHHIHMERGDQIYMFSDGYADSFNGKSNKKLTTKKFKELLLLIRDKSIQEQKNTLDSFIEEWKAGTEQIDDILVIGIRF